MNSNHYKLSIKTIRFRRWSRKGYAVFAGLNKVISIGRIGSSISDKALLKNKRTSIFSSFFTFDNSDLFYYDEEPHKEQLEYDLFSQNFALTKATDIPVGCKLQYYLLTQSWIRARSLFQLFYF
ncbi:MAG: hypothetical protein GX102_02055 [Porphyromonadaceae bacterium]|jgi:hypothetical protein|nr:hypothetical protein [Porphyromonadaceae bacterium]